MVKLFSFVLSESEREREREKMQEKEKKRKKKNTECQLGDAVKINIISSSQETIFVDVSIDCYRCGQSGLNFTVTVERIWSICVSKTTARHCQQQLGLEIVKHLKLIFSFTFATICKLIVFYLSNYNHHHHLLLLFSLDIDGCGRCLK